MTAIDIGDEVLPARPGLWRRLPHDSAVLISGATLAAIVLAAIFAPLLAPYDPYEPGQPPFIPPSFMEGGMPQFLLGTDNQGRDLLSRLLYGTRTTLITGVLAIVGRNERSRGRPLAQEFKVAFVTDLEGLLEQRPAVVVEAASHEAVREYGEAILGKGIAKLKLPERLVVVPEMPLTPTRKIIKGKLKLPA